MKNAKRSLTYCLILTTFLAGCSHDKGTIITAEEVPPVEVDILPYHSLISDPATRDATLQDHQMISNILFQHIVGLPAGDSVAYRTGIDTFLAQAPTQNIALIVDSVYSDMTQIEEDWAKSMALFKHYFPDRQIPKLYFLQSNLGIANFVFETEEGEDAVAASLDFFLGEAFPYTALAQENPAFSRYNSRTFNPDHLVTKSVNAVIDDMVGEVPESNFINLMIREGKRLYVLERLCPHLPDSAIFEYSPEDLAWCENNEFEIWNFFLEQELLYENALIKVAKYLNPAPTSQGMPPESPGRTAVFTGYKIVEAYMDRRPGTDIRYLLSQSDAQAILEEARYKPRTR
jgi:hypothetical protein